MREKSVSNIDNNYEVQNESSINKIDSKSEPTKTKRVDINVLKSKLQEIESKTFKRNLSIFFTLILILAFLGIYLSL
tara:strand:+ start:163 stop:393 length:231 start_codon:yes stop_codon:yes gene_type:complete